MTVLRSTSEYAQVLRVGIPNLRTTSEYVQILYTEGQLEEPAVTPDGYKGVVTRQKSSTSNGISPVGYYTLGQAYPRTSLRSPTKIKKPKTNPKHDPFWYMLSNKSVPVSQQSAVKNDSEVNAEYNNFINVEKKTSVDWTHGVISRLNQIQSAHSVFIVINQEIPIEWTSEVPSYNIVTDKVSSVEWTVNLSSSFLQYLVGYTSIIGQNGGFGVSFNRGLFNTFDLPNGWLTTIASNKQNQIGYISTLNTGLQTHVEYIVPTSQVSTDRTLTIEITRDLLSSQIIPVEFEGSEITLVIAARKNWVLNTRSAHWILNARNCRS
jgi:hypothetical protein